jgi:cell division protein DivIC
MKLLQDLLYRFFKIPHSAVNKYSAAGFLFFIYVGFLDNHSFLDSFKLNNILKDYEDQKQYYIREIEKAKSDKIDLETNLEKYAREKFFMHKKNEDVFIIERK